jgi:hypothetical protein
MARPFLDELAGYPARTEVPVRVLDGRTSTGQYVVLS